MVAAKIANLPEGRPSAETAPRGAVSQSDAAAQLDVSRRSAQRAVRVLKEAEPGDIKAVEDGEKTVTEIVKKIKAKAEQPKQQQPIRETQSYIVRARRTRAEA